MPAASAGAAPRALAAQGTPFANSSFLSYATGAQVHLNAVQITGTKLVGVDQAFSGVSVNSGGLGTAINDPVTSSLVQPSLPGANASARGSGLEVGLGLPTTAANQLQLGIAQAQAPPISPPVVKTVIPINIPGILTAGVLKGIAAANYLPTFCPVGQPIALGEGDAAGVALLGSPPVLGLSGSSTQTAQSISRTDLVANTDGTFGLSSQVSEHIAPVSINLGTGLSIQVSLGGSGINNPITMTTATDGMGHTATTLVDTGTLVVTLVTPLGTTSILNVDLTKILGPGGLVVDANTLPVVGPVLTALGIVLNLTVAAPPHPLPGFPSGANAKGSAFDLLSLNVALGSIQVAGLNVGHMETGVDLANGPISCTVPVAKTANPAVVQAGNTFTWSISIPSSAAALADSTCDLTNIKVTDKISINKGSPTFTIGSISSGGVYDTATKTVTWANLGTYHPGDPPKVVTIQVTVPSNSSAGVLADTANVTAGLGNCNGGATGVATAIGAVQNAIIGGSITLIAPEITTGNAGIMPLTGNSRPMLPWLAVALLVMAEGTRRIVRRARQTP